MDQQRLAGLSILLAGYLLSTAEVQAATWQGTVTSRLSTEYDSNPTMSPNYPGGVWRALFEPGYLATGREGVDEFRAGVGIQVERSSDTSLSQNRNSPRVGLDWRHEGEVNTIGISYNYFETAIRNAGPIAVNQGLYGTSASGTLSGTWGYALGERSTLSADGSYQAVSYKGPGPYLNYSMRTAGLKYSYELSERNTSFVRVSDSEYVPSDGGQAIRVPSALLGLDLKTEKTEWIVEGGRFRDNHGHSGPIGSLEAHFNGERNQLVLTVGHVVLASGLGGVIKDDQKKVSWRYALSENSNTGIDVERNTYYYVQKSSLPIVAINAVDYSATAAGAWLEHDLNVFWKVRTYYQHRMNKITGGDGAFSNMVGISFGYLNPNF